MNRFVIADSTVCIGCRTCEAACAETHRQHGLQAMPRLHLMRNEKESAPQMCHQCEDAPCAAVCPVNAINRVDGAVQLNESLCVSCKLCGIACPFGAIEFSGSRPLDIPANANTPLAPRRAAGAGPRQHAARLGAGRARHRRQMRSVPLRRAGPGVRSHLPDQRAAAGGYPRYRPGQQA